MGFGQRPCAGSALSLPKASAKQRPCRLGSGLALSVIASRCHLSQSERPWQSAKFPVYTLRPAAAKRAVRRCAETFRLCQGLPLWGSWREAPERARTAEGRLRPGLAGAYDGVDFRKLNLNLRSAFLSAGLPSPSSLRDATSPKVRGLGSPQSFPVWNLYALLPQGEPSGAALRLSAFAKGSPFGGAGKAVRL